MDLDQPTVRETKKGLEIRVRVSPNSSRDSICFREGEAVSVKLKSPPIDGRANRELIKIISKRLGVAPSKVIVSRGSTSRDKTLLVQEVSETDAIRLLMKV